MTHRPMAQLLPQGLPEAVDIEQSGAGFASVEESLNKSVEYFEKQLDKNAVADAEIAATYAEIAKLQAEKKKYVLCEGDDFRSHTVEWETDRVVSGYLSSRQDKIVQDLIPSTLKSIGLNPKSSKFALLMNTAIKSLVLAIVSLAS